MRPVRSGPFDQTAIVADVALAGLRILGDPVAGGDVRAVVETGGGDRHGKFVDAAMGEQIGAHVNFFLGRAAVDHDRRDQIIQRMDPAIGNFLGLAFESQRINRLRAGQAADQDRAVVFVAFAVDDVVEQKAAALRFGDAAAILPAHQRLQFAVFVDFAVNAIKFFMLFQFADKLAQIVIGFGKIHRVLVYDFFSGLSRPVRPFCLQNCRRIVRLGDRSHVTENFQHAGERQEIVHSYHARKSPHVRLRRDGL